MVGTTVPTHEITVTIKSCRNSIRLLKKVHSHFSNYDGQEEGLRLTYPQAKSEPRLRHRARTHAALSAGALGRSLCEVARRLAEIKTTYSTAGAKPHTARASSAGHPTSPHIDLLLQHLLCLGSPGRFPSPSQLSNRDLKERCLMADMNSNSLVYIPNPSILRR
jgi:hypothetical protein